ncbi:7-carboxy-7-deazaguanine synthase QueE [Sporolituus thermophilus]|uniref:7-carboxy-7-deazaguanine synthase n=1 Tax=Sporolituus thermophilus DSM 23256 TaxID=1123285 RepID=A0A1G7NX05_9FIRM|nr:7-carboxy-7-deazaguanine synthase QueE [Sporolituus thermophilus]SDF78565.1 Organic radical activating enzyme [Sporolituus thermophilus DSM 23256]
MSAVVYPVIEIFESIQGEGTHMGMPAAFIRLAGCNLRCKWCDTANAFDLKNATYLAPSHIVAKIKQKLVVITGGEPTLHDLKPLVAALHERGKYVAVETNGTNPIPEEWGIDWITASPKPGSGYLLACQADELKYVVDDEFTLDCVAYDAVPPGRIFLQVESGRKESAQKAFALVMKNPERGLRLGIQLHKILGVE